MDNSQQIEFWNGPAGEQWRNSQEDMDATLRPFAEAALAFANPQPDEKVLDVGCGCGDTTLRLADRVGRDGIAIGVDISGPMIERARDRVGAYETMGLPAPKFLLEDASSYKPKVPSFDLVFSRFGVMFFAEPSAAFANLRAALRPGGRIAFICWQPLTENEWFSVPLAAAGKVLDLPPGDPDAPGPFAFGDRAKIERILDEAGFRSPTITSCEIAMDLGPVAEVEAAAGRLSASGPASRAMAGASDAERAEVQKILVEALKDHVIDGTITLHTKTWLVGAQNP